MSQRSFSETEKVSKEISIFDPTPLVTPRDPFGSKFKVVCLHDEGVAVSLFVTSIQRQREHLLFI